MRKTPPLVIIRNLWNQTPRPFISRPTPQEVGTINSHALCNDSICDEQTWMAGWSPEQHCQGSVYGTGTLWLNHEFVLFLSLTASHENILEAVLWTMMTTSGVGSDLRMIICFLLQHTVRTWINWTSLDRLSRWERMKTWGVPTMCGG